MITDLRALYLRPQKVQLYVYLYFLILNTLNLNCLSLQLVSYITLENLNCIVMRNFDDLTKSLICQCLSLSSIIISSIEKRVKIILSN